MKKFKLIFFIVYGSYHAFLVGFSFYATNMYLSNNLSGLIDLSKTIPWARWISLLGVFFFLINLVLFLIVANSRRSRIRELEKERDKFKASMYDMQARMAKSLEAKPEASETQESSNG